MELVLQLEFKDKYSSNVKRILYSLFPLLNTNKLENKYFLIYRL
jgi:hypothetical protein